MIRSTTRHYNAEAEQKEILRVIERLKKQFPEVQVEEIERAVHGRYTSFEGSPIRDFVPILVERASRQSLSDSLSSKSASAGDPPAMPIAQPD
jgi:hypothetical protein